MKYDFMIERFKMNECVSAGGQQSSVGSRQCAISNIAVTNYSGLLTSDYRLQTVDCRLRTVNCELIKQLADEMELQDSFRLKRNYIL